jgi:hypothetical protein
MADNRYRDFTQEAIDALNALEQRQGEVQDRIQARINRNLNTQTQVHQRLVRELDEVSDSIDDIIEREKERLNYNKQLAKENTNYFRSISKIAPETRKILGIERDRSTSAGVFSSLSKDVIEMKSREVNLSDDELETSMYRRGILEEQLAAQQSQAAALIRAKKEEDDISKFKEEQTYYDSLRGELGDEIVDKLIDSSKETENIYKQEQRTLQLKEQQKGLYDSIPDSIKSGLDFSKSLFKSLKSAGPAVAGFAILATILTSAVTSFVALDAAAEKFNQETGLAVSQVKELRTQANNLVADFREIGLEAQDYYDIQKEIVGVLGDTARVSDSVAGAQAVITKNFGVSNKAAAETLQIFQSLGGVSENTAASLQLQTMELAKQSGVAPAKVLEDIAESSDAIYGAFRGNTEELITQAVQARRLGTNLKDVLATTDKLLDFESSITQELEASAFVGGQFNLSQARALRAAGDIAGAQEEILRQIQRSGDFREQDVFTQRALAEAAGMTVDEIARQLTTQDKLNSLSADQKKLAEDAIAQGLDITNINDNQLAQEVQKFALQKEQQGQLTNILNAFQGIAATLGATLVPLLEAITPLLTLALAPIQLMAEGFSSIVGFINEYKNILGPLTLLLGGVWAIQKGIVLWQRKEAVIRLLNIKRAAAMASISALSNPAKALAGLAAASIVVGIASKYMSKADDAMIPKTASSGYGKRALLEEGSITLFNNKDTIVAGTDLDKGLDIETPKTKPEYVSPFDNKEIIKEKITEVESAKPKPEYITNNIIQPEIIKEKVKEVELAQPEIKPEYVNNNIIQPEIIKEKVKEVELAQPEIKPEYVNNNIIQPETEYVSPNITQPLVKPEYVSPFNNQQRLNERTDKVEVVKPENNGTDRLIKTIERLEKAYMRGAQVNLDGQKVIRGLGRVGDETTQNNFSLI